MSTHHVVYVFLIAAAGVLSASLSVGALRNRDIVGALPLGILLSAVTLWSAGKLVELASPGLAATVFWANVQYLGIVVVVATWLLFALAYTGRSEWLTGRTVLLLAVEPVLVLAAVGTNGSHGLFRTSTDLVAYGSLTGLTSTPGPAFWIHSAYSYLLLFLGAVLILRLVARSGRLFRSQAVGLLLAVFSPWIGNGLFLAGVAPPALDTTIIGFSVTGTVLAVITVRHRLLDIVPAVREVARDELIESMTDAVLVVDHRNRLVDANPAAESLLGEPIGDAVGEPIDEVFPALADAVEGSESDGGASDGGLADGGASDGGRAEGGASDDDEPFRTEIERREESAVRYYDVRVSPLERGLGAPTGRLISLRDVSDQRQREQQLEVLNRLLRHNFRNDATAIQGNASLLREEVTDPAALRRLETINRTVETMIERNERFSHLIGRLDDSDRDSIDLTAEIEGVVADKRRRHPEVTIVFDRADPIRVDTGEIVVSALDELITNSIDHNDAERPRVRVSVTPAERSERDAVRIRIRDNGPGIPDREIRPIDRGTETPLEHASGVGLWLATWIIREVDGSISFAEDRDGTAVTVFLPADRSSGSA
ncbi:histidine kinase N-terminal 7TM domain-containing protein [Halorubrum sp. LN27]|uniref:histidine kinase N-terminal 7TM domain-containing protein n=1 Tax=Halorubrum sp. LN27 TaxID=2801032 RepID=UPI00190D5B58|nr:histidine kinase N-terminal 7TM domain-containing protein [Halorubrum sp. LN27]